MDWLDWVYVSYGNYSIGASALTGMPLWFCWWKMLKLLQIDVIINAIGATNKCVSNLFMIDETSIYKVFYSWCHSFGVVRLI